VSFDCASLVLRVYKFWSFSVDDFFWTAFSSKADPCRAPTAPCAHPKSEIFAFAHRYGVPYLKDTTGRWSTRGALRTDLMPLLKVPVPNPYGPGDQTSGMEDAFFIPYFKISPGPLFEKGGGPGVILGGELSPLPPSPPG